MARSANDIALVITTTATAVTAMSGFVVPLWTRGRDVSRQQAREKYERLFASVLEMVEIADDFHRANDDIGIFQAFSQDSIVAGSAVKMDNVAATMQRFWRCRRRTELLAQDIGIDPSAYLYRVAMLSEHQKEFKVVAGSL